MNIGPLSRIFQQRNSLSNKEIRDWQQNIYVDHGPLSPFFRKHLPPFDQRRLSGFVIEYLRISFIVNLFSFPRIPAD
jgi:hypothetical protein